MCLVAQHTFHLSGLFLYIAGVRFTDMVSANDAVFQRRNKQIQDAIDGQNLKQALNLIEKRTKKGEDTVFLKVRSVLRVRL